MTTLVLFVATLTDGGRMAASSYAALSDLPDTSAPGGFGTSTNASWSLKDLAIEAEGLQLVVKKNDCCGPSGGECEKIVVLANATAEPVWLNAWDSTVALIREAKDAKGVWRPVEYRQSPDCGNSCHQVALNPGRCWVWNVPTSAGIQVTKGRYVLHGRGKPVVSGEFETRVDPMAFVLPTQFATGYKMSPDGTVSRS